MVVANMSIFVVAMRIIPSRWHESCNMKYHLGYIVLPKVCILPIVALNVKTTNKINLWIYLIQGDTSSHMAEKLVVSKRAILV